jgi:hypothetical protein
VRCRSSVLLFCLVISASGAAHAQSASEIAAAKQWFTEGLALEEKDQFKEALDRFRRAAQVKKTPQILFHVGLCEAKTGQLVEGLVNLERAVELGKSDGNDQVVTAATGEIASLKPRIPNLELAVSGSEQPKSLTLDDNALSESTIGSPIPVNPGAHVLKATFSTGEVTKRFSVKEGERARVELAAPQGDEPTGGVGPSPPGTPPPPRSGTPPEKDQPAAEGPGVLPWVLIGGGVVFAVGGFYAWKLRGDQVDELDSICPTRDSCPANRESDVDDHESKGKLYTTLGIGAWVLGAAAIGTGTVLLLGSKKSETAVRFTPSVAPGLAAATFGGRF